MKYLRTHPNGVIGSGLDRAGEQGIKDEENVWLCTAWLTIKK